MGLRERLDGDLKDALREKNQVKLSTLRMVKSAMKYKETEPGAQGPLDDVGITQVITSEMKKRRDAIAEYEKAARTDLAEKESVELSILMSYLPAQLTPSELEALVDEAIAETGAAGPKEMGLVMKALQPRTAGRADGRAISELVKQKLQALK